MKEFRPSIKRYYITNYFEYEYFYSVNVTYYNDKDIKTVLTIDIIVSLETMLDKVVNENSNDKIH